MLGFWRGGEPIISARREAAVIEEEITLTSWGKVCRLLLVIQIVATIIALVAARTAAEQGLYFGASFFGLMLFGSGMALGRRRVYRIYKSDDAADIGMAAVEQAVEADFRGGLQR